MKNIILSIMLLGIMVLIGGDVYAQYREYHVSVKGNDSNAGTISMPFKTINRAAKVAMPGDVITVHEGIYREKIVPPRGGISDKQRITYQAAKGERVVITGSNVVKGWELISDCVWKVTLPEGYFDSDFNPFDEQLYGSWYHGKGKINHTGSVFFNGRHLKEAYTKAEVFDIASSLKWYAKCNGNGGSYLMNLEWIQPAGGEKVTSMQASVKGGDQAICISIHDRWPFGYLKDKSIIYFNNVDFAQGTDTIYYQVASQSKGGIIEIYLDNPNGELLGTAMVTNTGDWENFQSFKTYLKRKLKGLNTICLVLKSPSLPMNKKTEIWAQFPEGIDPNEEQVEVSVRPQVFYPDSVGINYITIKGFVLENAATNWAPPSAEQPGLIGTRWGKGWIIENNIIRNSRCAGISLGRPTFGHAHHYQKQLPPQIYVDINSGQTEDDLLNYFSTASWDKEKTGYHIIRNNDIYECGQAGIVGCSGGAFSVIEGNNIHDVCINESFSGEEMAGIKLHFATDVIIRNNHIYRCIRGLWLDWGCQGAQVLGNLFHDNNTQEDIFVEVSHGPILVANNIMLSNNSFIPAQGMAMVNNLFCGRIKGGQDRCEGGRKSFYYPPHETNSLGLEVNVGGDWKWYNNIFVGEASLNNWDDPLLPRKYQGNIYTKGVVADTLDINGFHDSNFDPRISLIQRGENWYLSMIVSKNWNTNCKRNIITTNILGKTITTKQKFTNPDDTLIKLDKDYFGHKKNKKNPSPGPIEIDRSGIIEWKVWPK